MRPGCLAAAIAAAIALAACAGGPATTQTSTPTGDQILANARVIQITQTDDGCTPLSIAIGAKETIRLDLLNRAAGEYRLAATDTDVGDLIVPAGELGSTFYADPGDGKSHRLRCYVLGGASTEITVRPE